jgi:predicted MFS family arabinose efflux permease
MYAGQAIGTALGGVLITTGRMDDLHWYGFVVLVLALAASLWATHLSNRLKSNHGLKNN